MLFDLSEIIGNSSGQAVIGPIVKPRVRSENREREQNVFVNHKKGV